MSWGKDPSKWGKPITVRFSVLDLERLEQLRKYSWESKSEIILGAVRKAAADAETARRDASDAAAIAEASDATTSADRGASDAAGGVRRRDRGVRRPSTSVRRKPAAARKTRGPKRRGGR